MEFLKSIYAGALIGLGGYLFLVSENAYIGAFLFSLGLCGVLLFQMNLYTGKTCNVEFWKRPYKLLYILAGNTVGAALIGWLISYESELVEISESVVNAKLNKSIPDLMVNGIICGICVAVAVKGFAAANKSLIIVILSVMAFILAGAEHIIADIFYVAAACMRSGNLTVNMVQFLLWVLLFNTIGGLIACPLDLLAGKAGK